MAGGLHQCGVELVEIHAGLDPEGQRLGGGHRVHEPGQVEKQLDGVAAAAGAEVEDLLRVAHRLQQRQGPGEGLRGAAGVDRERARLGADRLPGHRGVDKSISRASRGGERPAAHLQRAGAHLDHQRARRQRGDRPLGAVEDLVHGGGPGQAGDEDLGAAHAVAHRVRGPRARLCCPASACGVEVEGRHLVTGRAQWRHMWLPMWPRPMNPTRRRVPGAPSASCLRPARRAHDDPAGSGPRRPRRARSPSPGAPGSASMPSASTRTGSASMKSRRSGVQPGGS